MIWMVGLLCTLWTLRELGCLRRGIRPGSAATVVIDVIDVTPRPSRRALALSARLR